MSDYEESLARHPHWEPEFKCTRRSRRFGWRLWTCRWQGPYGGNYKYVRLTRAGTIRASKNEIAS